MPNDALNYHFIANELNAALTGCRIEKIYMPSAGEIILRCHKDKTTCYLLACAASSAPRIHLTEAPKDNPVSAPSFLMHLRKHIGNGLITSVRAVDYERVVMIDIDSKSEFVESKYKLIVEITGTYSNIILVDERGIISAAIKNVTPGNSARLVMSGLPYTPIPPQNKILPCDRRIIDLLNEFDGDRPDKYLLSIMSGMAPATITECVTRAMGSMRKPTERDAEAIFAELDKIYSDIRPCLIKHDGKYIEFCTSPFCSLTGEVEFRPTLNECMDAFYAQKNDGGDFAVYAKRLMSIVKNAQKRTKKKLEEFAIKKAECMDCDADRIKGELLTANLYLIKKGMTAVSVFNYYDNKNIEIILDDTKTPSQNAQDYFKRYNKKKNALVALDKQIADAENMLLKYENALNSFELCSTRADLEDIETELSMIKLLQNKETKNKKKVSKYLSATIGGFKIDIGKNNVQNERLYKSAAPKDIWLHVKDAHGSHVIIRCAGQPLDDDILVTAARLAAYYSKSRMADKVAVDYTYAMFVKPIGGAGPGKVNYTNQKTLFVSPLSLTDLGVRE